MAHFWQTEYGNSDRGSLPKLDYKRLASGLLTLPPGLSTVHSAEVNYRVVMEGPVWQAIQGGLQLWAPEDLARPDSGVSGLGSRAFSIPAAWSAALPAPWLQPVSDPKPENLVMPCPDSWLKEMVRK